MPDVNVLVYALRKDHVEHDFYRDWLQRLVNADAPFAISSLIAIGVVRILTHPGFAGGPTPLVEAFEQMGELMEQPNCRLLGPEGTHWFRVKTLCQATKTAGGKIADAQHAAVAIEHGCTLVSRDRDFERFRSHGLDFELLEP